jgi:uncharacterized membrane protein
MGFLIFYLILISLPILVIWPAVRSCHIAYFILDSVVIGFFFVYGTVNSWDYKSSGITGYSHLYMAIRLFAVSVYAGIMKVLKKKIAPRHSAELIVMGINITGNIVATLFFISHLYIM